MEGRTLKTVLNKDSKTLAIMDAFEGRGADKTPYDRIVVLNGMDSYVKTKNGEVKKVTYQYVIERSTWNKPKVGNLLMSNFKYGHNGELSKYINSQLRKGGAENYIDKDKVYYFDKPYSLNAQNSSNREGYGSYYEWDECIWEGTYYGETTQYVIAGVVLTSRCF